MLDAGNQEGDLEEVDIELSPICLEAFPMRQGRGRGRSRETKTHKAFLAI